MIDTYYLDNQQYILLIADPLPIAILCFAILDCSIYIIDDFKKKEIPTDRSAAKEHEASNSFRQIIRTILNATLPTHLQPALYGIANETHDSRPMNELPSCSLGPLCSARLYQPCWCIRRQLLTVRRCTLIQHGNATQRNERPRLSRKGLN